MHCDSLSSSHQDDAVGNQLANRHLRRCHQGSLARRRQDRRLRQAGFTLVELLLVIAIIAILTSLALAIVLGADESAREARTESQVQRINQLLLAKWEAYNTRILRFRLADVKFGGAPIADMSATEIERIRTRALMDLARVEFPNSYANLAVFPSLHSQLAPIGDFPTGLDNSDPVAGDLDKERAGTPNAVDVTEPSYWPAAWRDNYLALLNAPQAQPSALSRLRFKLNMSVIGTNPNGIDLWGPSGLDVWPPQNASQELILQNEQAECLYALLQTVRLDGMSGLEYAKVRSSEIADTDGDGRFEIVDAFGDPLYFIYATGVARPAIDTLEPKLPAEIPFVIGSFNLDGL